MKKLTFGQKLIGWLSFGLIKPSGSSSPSPSRPKRPSSVVTSSRSSGDRPTRARSNEPRHRSDPNDVESPRLHVGNLSYDATEQDLSELFNGVGSVQDAEVVAHSRTHRSKGFAFVSMNTIDEARRAVEVLDNQSFMGRKLSVSGAKSPGRQDRLDDESNDSDNDNDDSDDNSDQKAAESVSDANSESSESSNSEENVSPS